MIKTILLQKNGCVISLLAREYLSMDVGEKIKTVREYAEEYSVGHGTIQVAIRKLIEIEAILIISKGHMGSFLNFVNYEILSELAGIGTIAGVMPIPTSRRYEGLATGLFEVLNQGKIRSSLAFMTGSKSRIESLFNNQYHYIILSKHSFNYYKKEYPELLIVEEFGDYSFISGHVLLFQKGFDVNSINMRIGIDKSSYDQMSITEKYIEVNKLNSNFYDIRYSSLVDSILSNKIDASIWSEADIKNKISGISEKGIGSILGNNDVTNACLVMNGDMNYLIKYIKKTVNIKKVIEIQAQVIDGTKHANY